MTSSGRGPADDADPSAPDEALRPERRRVAGIVLAAGSATRMGRPKTTLRLEGRTLLDHVIDAALDARLAEVVVVLRPDDRTGRDAVARRADDRVRAALARDADRGIGRSLAAGIAALDDAVDAAAVLLADQPGVGAALIERVVEAAAASPRPAVRPVHTVDGRRVPGHPVVLARALFADAAALEGDAGARALWTGAPERLEEIPVPTPPAPDVDTPEDYRRLVARASRRPR